MKSLRKGLDNIKTIRSLVNRCKGRTPHGALFELGRLRLERERLCQERQKWERRIKQIESRLKDIGEMEEWLNSFIDKDGGGVGRSGDSASDFEEMILKY